MSEVIYKKLNALRDEYRKSMNDAASKAQAHASLDEMDRVSEYSTESERSREAFHAMNRAIKIVEDELPQQRARWKATLSRPTRPGTAT